MDNQVGLGVYSEDLGLEMALRLPDYCSVYQAEILAIAEVAKWLRCNVLTKVGINIFSDSQAAIKSLESVFLNSTSALNCRKSLNEMAQQFDIHLIWVPGHRDIPGNCRADELARLGSTLRVPARLESVGMPLATCKLFLREKADREANDRWTQGRDCVHARQMWPRLDTKRSLTLLSLSRSDASLIVSVMTGHCLIGKHAMRLKAPANDYCRSCEDEEEDESIKHLLCTCPALANRRGLILGSYFYRELSDLADVRIGKLISFLRSTNWF